MHYFALVAAIPQGTKKTEIGSNAAVFGSFPDRPIIQNFGVGANGECGSSYGKCNANECCSRWGWCNRFVNSLNDPYCGTGCQLAYGLCAGAATTSKSTAVPTTTKVTSVIPSTTSKATTTTRASVTTSKSTSATSASATTSKSTTVAVTTTTKATSTSASVTAAPTKGSGAGSSGGAACTGQFYPDSASVVALISNLFVGSCGKTVTIFYRGKSVSATVVDECASSDGCLANSIDATLGVWAKLGIDPDLGIVDVTYNM
ncbi:hypothetical protein EDD86DRAFT_266393 [Gorgonomyces haynaldii]|nr:hypothetical protein EDD86DRAFT_266393 [Gorgonomyces haynaldii]